MKKYAKNVDTNQLVVVWALRLVGATVEHRLSRVGEGVPDLLVGWCGKNLLMEVKDGRLAPSHRKLSATESKWHQWWGGQVYTVNGVADALGLLGAFSDQAVEDVESWAAVVAAKPTKKRVQEAMVATEEYRIRRIVPTPPSRT